MIFFENEQPQFKDLGLFTTLSNRMLLLSLGHPTVDGRTAADLAPGALYEGARVVSSDLILYNNEATYDLLPSGETGFYFANGIPLGSTLRR